MSLLKKLMRGSSRQPRMVLGRQPVPIEEMKSAEEEAQRQPGGGSSPQAALPETPIPLTIDEIENYLTVELGTESADVVMRRLSIWTQPEINGFLFLIDGLASRDTANLMALRSVMLAERAPALDPSILNRDNAADVLMTHLVPSAQVKVVETMDEVISRVLTGEGALFVEGTGRCIMFEAKGMEHRGVEEPHTEKVVRGPREGFTELIRANTAMVRRRLRTPDLRLDSMELGQRSKTSVAVAYVEGLTDPGLVAEVKTRLKAIVTDMIPDSGFVEEMIEDNPYSPFPQIQYTERPDRMCAGLSEGLVGILVDGTPMALMIPANLASFFQSPEDYYERSPFGGPLRLLRYVAGILALTFPAVYVAITTFHQEMLPTKLALVIAGSHMPVPFPALVEALLMEIALELIREAGVRLPDPVGQTLGFVGALILGDAAVSAGLVSPIMVIVVAVTGLASFSVPHYPTGLALRLLRFPLLFLGAFLGLFGVMAGVLAIGLHLGALTSFGVPYLNPLMNPREVARDVLWRSPVFMFQRRPGYAHPQDMIRQKAFIRTWSPEVAARAKAADEHAGGGGGAEGRSGGAEGGSGGAEGGDGGKGGK